MNDAFVILVMLGALAVIAGYHKQVNRLLSRVESEQGRAEYYRRHIDTLKRRNAALRGHHGGRT